MPQDIRRSALNRPCLLVRARLRDRVAQRLGEARDDGGVVPGEVVELDGLGGAVVLFGVLRGADEDLFVVVGDVLEFEEGGALFDDTALQIE